MIIVRSRPLPVLPASLLQAERDATEERLSRRDAESLPDAGSPGSVLGYTSVLHRPFTRPKKDAASRGVRERGVNRSPEKSPMKITFLERISKPRCGRSPDRATRADRRSPPHSGDLRSSQRRGQRPAPSVLKCPLRVSGSWTSGRKSWRLSLRWV